MVTGLLMRFLMWFADKLDPEEDWDAIQVQVPVQNGNVVLVDIPEGFEDWEELGWVWHEPWINHMPEVAFLCDCKNCTEMAKRRHTQCYWAPWN